MEVTAKQIGPWLSRVAGKRRHYLGCGAEVAAGAFRRQSLRQWGTGEATHQGTVRAVRATGFRWRPRSMALIVRE
jgi:hypothetical protein